MDLNKGTIIDKLKKIQDRELFKHSMGTSEMAVRLAVNLNKKKPFLKINVNKVEMAALLHDWAKGSSKNKLLSLLEKYKLHVDKYEMNNWALLHGPVGAAVIKNELGVKDKVILKAVKVHTTGCVKMSIFDKIIFVSDHIEINREYRRVAEIRNVAMDDFDKAVIMVMENKISYVLQKRGLLHPKTISAWNAAIQKIV